MAPVTMGGLSMPSLLLALSLPFAAMGQQAEATVTSLLQASDPHFAATATFPSAVLTTITLIASTGDVSDVPGADPTAPIITSYYINPDFDAIYSSVSGISTTYIVLPDGSTVILEGGNGTGVLATSTATPSVDGVSSVTATPSGGSVIHVTASDDVPTFTTSPTSTQTGTGVGAPQGAGGTETTSSIGAGFTGQANKVTGLGTGVGFVAGLVGLLGAVI
ncbi:hypothetical protein PV10_06275 [Exophiala mesophila]|uniref:FAS1 domain-containing protein n=1 Tax=Exophiala mesophila TaxID=212818 RepID=A0A0D1ZCU1_EXOME|nr:uncharacterized protein PV10_06275 [Exophiala mesophila]KIV91769.1 hypothetical protein PV10_06275 [Exophiala mesophila]